LRRAERINGYGRAFGAQGFRSAVLYRNPSWYDALKFSYDMSIPNVGHLDPQRGGCCTVLPFFIGDILELPVTATQDYTLFHMLNDYSMQLWTEQSAVILKNNGLLSFIVHPDYILEDKARNLYVRLLEHLARLKEERRTWIALPGEAARWWRLRSKMKLERTAGEWRITGEGSDRARVAYARLEKGDRLSYEFA
jgi:hypothetical protein